MAELADVQDPIALLDVGCGSGMALRYLLSSGRDFSYCGIDRNATRLYGRFASGDYRFEDIDLEEDWHVGEFDVAWCSEVLEHLIDDAGLLSRIARSVRPDGRTIVTMPSLTFIDAIGEHVPEILEVSETQDGGHVRKGYTRESIDKLAKAAGYDVVRIGAISKCSVSQMRIRYTAPQYRRMLSNFRSIDRAEPETFLRDVDGRDDLLSQYNSIAAVLRIA